MAMHENAMQTTLFTLAKTGSSDLMSSFLSENKDIDLNVMDKNYYTPLMHAVKDNPAAVQPLIDAGADVNIQGKNICRTALCLAIQRNNPELVKTLVQAGSHVNIPNSSEKNTFTTLDYIKTSGVLNKSSDINQRIDRNSILKILIEAGAEINASSLYITPLIKAILSRDTSLIKLLIDNGADVNFPNKNESTPLIIASKVGDSSRVNYSSAEVVEMLLDAGADINYQWKNGSTPLLFAAQARNIKIMQLLIDVGCDVNHTNKSGQNAIYWALRNGNYNAARPIIQLLIKAGIDIDATMEQLKGLPSYAKPLKKILMSFYPYVRTKIIGQVMHKITLIDSKQCNYRALGPDIDEFRESLEYKIDYEADEIVVLFDAMHF